MPRSRKPSPSSTRSSKPGRRLLLLTMVESPAWLEQEHQVRINTLAPQDAGLLVARVERRCNIEVDDSFQNRGVLEELVNCLANTGIPGQIVDVVPKIQDDPATIMGGLRRQGLPRERRAVSFPLVALLVGGCPFVRQFRHS